MTDKRDVGAEAIAQAALSIALGTLHAMVKRGLATNKDMKQFLGNLAREQQSLYDETGILYMPSEAAAHILEELAKKFGGQESKP
jgi:hypothetical protein